MNLASRINDILIKIDLSIDNFESYEDVYNNFLDYINYDDILPTRLFDKSDVTVGEYRIFAALEKGQSTDHWMLPQCVTDKNYTYVPIDELYGRSEYKDYANSGNVKDENGVFSKILIKEICKLKGHFSIFFIRGESSPSVENSLKAIHPYSSAFTLNGLMRLILEWDWAYVYCDNREPMAEICHAAADYLGISAEEPLNETSQDIISLSDMQVASYIKTGETIINDEEWSYEKKFLLWLLQNEKIDISEITPNKQLYNNCRNLVRHLSNLLGSNP